VAPGVTGTVNLTFLPAGAENVNATFDDGTDGGPPASTTWDPSWSLNGVAYTNGNLSIASATAATTNVRTIVGHSSGKWYWEVTATGGDGTTNSGGLGIAESAMPNNAPWVGNVPSGLSFGYACCSGTYFYSWSGLTVSTVPPPATSAVKAGNVYMFALDMNGGRFWAGVNGAWFGSGDPVAGTNPVATGVTGTVYPAVTLYANSILAFTANFGASAFANPVPAGYTGGFY
jgi:hypothetical protein